VPSATYSDCLQVYLFPYIKYVITVYIQEIHCSHKTFPHYAPSSRITLTIRRISMLQFLLNNRIICLEMS